MRLQIKNEIESLETELDRLLRSSAATTRTGDRGMIAAGRAAIAAAQRARWAKLNGGKTDKSARKGKRKMSQIAALRLRREPGEAVPDGGNSSVTAIAGLFLVSFGVCQKRLKA